MSPVSTTRPFRFASDAAAPLAARKGRVSLTGLTALSPKAAAVLRGNAGIELPACQR